MLRDYQPQAPPSSSTLISGFGGSGPSQMARKALPKSSPLMVPLTVPLTFDLDAGPGLKQEGKALAGLHIAHPAAEHSDAVLQGG